MEIYSFIAILISITALFSYFIVKYTKLPTTIGVMIVTIGFSFVLVWFSRMTSTFTDMGIKKAIDTLDFHDLLLNRMLGFLLFAGAIHINASDLKKQRLPVIALASFGTLISTATVGTLIYFLFTLFHVEVPYIYCLLFGSLISPTDPIAVLGILRQSNIPKSLEMKITGESLFNDGVALVIFTMLYEVALSGIEQVSVGQVALLFVKEAGGGILFGIILGYIGYFLLKSIDNYGVETLITVAIVMGGFEFANSIHISGALSMVVAGIITGNPVKDRAVSDKTRDYLGKFWELIDEILNAILFMLIGLEMLVVPISASIILFGCIAIVVVLLSRYFSVGLSVFLFRRLVSFEKHSVKVLTWGGLRGGISVAMALSLSESMFKNEFVAITYVIVVFSIIVQGLTIGKVAKRLTAA